MNLEGYIELSKASAHKVTIAGCDHYLNKKINHNVYNVLKDKDLNEQDRIHKSLMCLICNEDGELIFDIDDTKHLEIVKNMDIDVKTVLMSKALDMLGGGEASKKK